MTIRSVSFLVTALIGLLSAAQPAAALENCKAKINTKDGTIFVSAQGVTGTLKWGPTSAEASSNTFFDPACVDQGTAKKCVLGDVGTEARIVPPRLCTIYLADDTGTCSSFLKRCTPRSNVLNSDVDEDGAPNATDNCPFAANSNQADSDNDGVGDVCDPADGNDVDGDGELNDDDNCAFAHNSDQADNDGDGIGNACDGSVNNDVDRDGVSNATDNCPVVGNPSQTDTDGDGVGDACDAAPGSGNGDVDDDGVSNATDNCPFVPNVSQQDSDGDALGDACDPSHNGDVDGDGVANNVDNCPLAANGPLAGATNQTDTDGDDLGDACEPIDDRDLDGDGVLIHLDNCPFKANFDQTDTDGDGVGNACDPRNDLDLDFDGVLNANDNCPFDANPVVDHDMNPMTPSIQLDTDGDGLGDACDPRNDLDLDGDTVINENDNCPFDPNNVFVDHDMNPMTPSIQEDTDLDGLGDACDPNP